METKTYNYKGFQIVKSETSGNYMIWKNGQRIVLTIAPKTLEQAKQEVRVEIEMEKTK